jgi:hypothetical protein
LYFLGLREKKHPPNSPLLISFAELWMVDEMVKHPKLGMDVHLGIIFVAISPRYSF